MRILVAGGSGLIGAHVVDVLRERGHAATTVARTARAGATGLLVHIDHDCFHQPWEEP
ncbi:NAD-dependent epimerase/dehydratase family protein [Micromonospora zamorensis]|uniref:NAD-dependent epimerase/dehydratase family protein n=1 Tax=Micromonospora zamorensis TaxID=709883 RepID=UPI002E21E46B